MTARLYLKCRSTSSASISVAFSFLVVCLAMESRSYAQSAEAEVLFNDGSRLMTEGNLEQACEAFEASNRIEPRAGTLILLGECREKNQQLASAWSAYRAAEARAKTPGYRVHANAKAIALAPQLSFLMVSVPEKSRVDGMTLSRNGKSFDSTLWNRSLPVDGGDYVITVRASGYDEWQTTLHIPVGGATLSVDVPTLTEQTTPALPSAPPPAPQPATTSTQSTSAAPRPSKMVPLFAVASTAVLLGSALGFELWAESNYAAAESELDSQARRDVLYDSANTIRRVAATFAASGLAAGGIAVWLYQRYRERGATIGTGVNVVPAGAGLALLGRF